jgi:hypothetical protein
MKSIFWALTLVAIGLGGTALGLTIEIEADGLEQRNITLPDGTAAQLVVLTGNPASLSFEGGFVQAQTLEFDVTNRLLRVVGEGYYQAEEGSTTGEDFVVDLSSERFRARDIILVTAAIDITGLEVTRFPGQVDVLSGSFSPCGRCAQRSEDYSFHAESLRLYPGDRIVATGVTVMLRGAAIFTLPLMVYPLGPEERRPRLSVAQGTATVRAEASLDWPYTAGAGAFGLLSLRYWADVTPGGGTFFSENLLGGGVDTHYLGGSILHRYYTDEAEGELDVGFTPYFQGATPDLDQRERFRLRWRHDSLPDLSLPDPGAPQDPGAGGDAPRIAILVERDDARRERLSEYRFSADRLLGDFQLRFLSRGYIDHEPELGLRLPSYLTFNTPERTFGQLSVRSREGVSFSAGPFVASNLELDLGVFEDSSNRLSRGAVIQGERLSEGRLLQGSSVRLSPVSPWAGLTIDGLNTFRGQYYTTGERLVQWNSRLNALQDFGGLGSLNVTFQRLVSEGETPFNFDALTPASRTELSGTLSLRPLPWLSLGLRETYVFVDTRRPDAVGPGPLETTLTLFENLNWLSLVLRNVYDVQEGDPGELRAELALRQAPFTLELSHIQDLDPQSLSRQLDEAVDTTRTTGRFGFSLQPYLQIDARSGYTYAPAAPAADGVFEFWDPLRLVVTAGSIEQAALLGTLALPGARVTYVRDVNRGETQQLGLEFAASLDPFELYLRQELDFVQNRLGNSRYVFNWRGVLGFEATGFAALPLEWFGLTPDPLAAQNWVFQLRDLQRPDGVEAWSLRYSTTFNPALAEGLGGFQGSRLDAFVNVPTGAVGPLTFGVDLAANLLVQDDLLPVSYLQSANLLLSAQLAERVGLQGTLRYRSLFDGTAVTGSTLEFADLALTVRVLDDVFVSTIFNDVWDFSGANPEQSPWNLQPLVYVVWDRCCWALYGSWDTSSGRVSLGVGAPGGSEGLQQEFETDIRLPGRD